MCVYVCVDVYLLQKILINDCAFVVDDVINQFVKPTFGNPNLASNFKIKIYFYNFTNYIY